MLRVPRKDLDYLLKVGPQQVPGTRLPLVSTLSDAEIAERLAAIDAVAQRGPFQPDWDSLGQLQNARLVSGRQVRHLHPLGRVQRARRSAASGIRATCTSQDSPEFKHHVATYGPQSKFGYKDFIPQFKAEKFDAAAWAKLFKEAGREVRDPRRRASRRLPDVRQRRHRLVGGQDRDRSATSSASCPRRFRNEGIVFGASSHRAEHWWFFDQGMYFDSDVRDPANAALYGPASNQRMAENQSEPPDQAFLDDWLLRSCEIVDKYRPQVVYFDWWICQPVFQPYLKRFAAYYYNRGAEWNQPVAINFKEWEGRSFPDGTGVFDIERGQSADIRPDLWQT